MNIRPLNIIEGHPMNQQEIDQISQATAARTVELLQQRFPNLNQPQHQQGTQNQQQPNGQPSNR